MSRFKHFAHSLVSGYLLLGANLLYTLASVPLALRYLSKAEFGLWALTTQIAAFVALVDLGMAGASRILVDYKDQKAGGLYGSVILTTLLVSCVQALGVLVCGGLLACWLPSALSVAETLRRPFLLLLIGQCGILGAGFLSRTFNYLLMAHQRYDVLNYLGCAAFAATFSGLWVCFGLGVGLLSVIAAQFLGWVVNACFAALYCHRLKLLPPRGAWGRPDWGRFKELFAYGMDIFLFTLGVQLITTSQSVLVTKLLGLEAVTVWSLCTRAYVMLQQVVFRVFDYSAAALAEMMVRSERLRLQTRCHDIISLSMSLAVVGGVGLAFCNQAFVRVWTSGRVSWPVRNDLLLAVAIVISAVAHGHVGLVGQTKKFGWLRYLYLVEGTFFVTLGIGLLPRLSFTGLLIASVAGMTLFRLPYGLWRTVRYFGLSWREVAVRWTKPAGLLALVLWPLGFGLARMTADSAPWARLVLTAGCLAILGAVGLGTFGLAPGLRQELWQRLFAGRRLERLVTGWRRQ